MIEVKYPAVMRLSKKFPSKKGVKFWLDRFPVWLAENVRDYRLWADLEAIVYKSRHPNLDSLRGGRADPF